MTPTTAEQTLCRRCGRPLTHPLSVAARIGLGCARHLTDTDVAMLAGRLTGVQLALDLDAPVSAEQAEREAA